jgi:hypothetical protein
MALCWRVNKRCQQRHRLDEATAPAWIQSLRRASAWLNWPSPGSTKRGIVELDEERKAAMVSNLLVVLCADQPVSPVVNTGTLYT